LFLIVFEKPPKPIFPISDRVLNVLGDPSQQWPALIIMEKNTFLQRFDFVGEFTRYVK
jgi:hypothetical protein